MRLAATLVFISWVAAGPAQSADVPDSILVAGRPGPGETLTIDELAKLPSITLAVSFDTEHGPREGKFEGPLLWTVLDHAGAIDVTKPRDQVRQTVLLVGRDGYTAVLALGELSPAFENKQVIVAERMDGKPLDHPRIVVPGDKRGGRGVHDLVRISVMGMDMTK